MAKYAIGQTIVIPSMRAHGRIVGITLSDNLPCYRVRQTGIRGTTWCREDTIQPLDGQS